MTTDNGLFAQAPPHTRPGDLVAIFVGVNMPVVLRPRTESATYQMVGPAYVHGVMDGEAIACRGANTEMQSFTMD